MPTPAEMSIEEILYGNINRGPRNAARVNALQGSLPNTTIGGNRGITNGEIDALLMQISPTAQREATARQGMAALAAPPPPVGNPWEMTPERAELDARAQAIMDSMLAGGTANPDNRGAFSAETFRTPTDRGGGALADGGELGPGFTSEGLRFNQHVTEKAAGPTPQTSPQWQAQHAERLQKRSDARDAQTARAQARSGEIYDADLFPGAGLGGMSPEMLAMELERSKLAEDARQFDATLGAAQSPAAIFGQFMGSSGDPQAAAAATEMWRRYQEGGPGGSQVPGTTSPALQAPVDEQGTPLAAMIREMAEDTKAPWTSLMSDYIAWPGHQPPNAHRNWLDRLAEEIYGLDQSGQINDVNRDEVAALLRQEVDRLGKGSWVGAGGVDEVTRTAAAHAPPSPELEFLLQMIGPR